VDASKVDVMEKLIHRQNSRRRINGEWFRLTVEKAARAATPPVCAVRHR
jgi:hypothetical protein